MLSQTDIFRTLDMIDHQHLDVRTITMGISLRGCADPNAKACARKIYDLSLIHICYLLELGIERILRQQHIHRRDQADEEIDHRPDDADNACRNAACLLYTSSWPSFWPAEKFFRLF